MVVATGFTAQRSYDLDDSSIITSAISGDNLLLTNRGGSVVNTGNVRGGVGSIQRYRTAFYYGCEGGRSSAAQPWGVMTLAPFVLHGSQAVIFDKIGAECVIGGDPGANFTGNFRVGIYRDNGQGKPSTKIIGGDSDYGSIAYQPIVHESPVDFLTPYNMNLSLNPGLYWLACLCSGSTINDYPVMRVVSNNPKRVTGSVTLAGALAAQPMIGWMQTLSNPSAELNMPATFTGTTQTATPTAVFLKTGG